MRDGQGFPALRLTQNGSGVQCSRRRCGVERPLVQKIIPEVIQSNGCSPGVPGHKTGQFDRRFRRRRPTSVLQARPIRLLKECARGRQSINHPLIMPHAGQKAKQSPGGYSLDDCSLLEIRSLSTRHRIILAGCQSPTKTPPVKNLLPCWNLTVSSAPVGSIARIVLAHVPQTPLGWLIISRAFVAWKCCINAAA